MARPKTVLIVDDIAFVRKTIAEILTRHHYLIVGEADNGISAMEQYGKLRPDVMLMDAVMPALGGIEAARRIIKKDRDAKIIICSALMHEHLVMEAINAGVRDYLMKPFQEEDLLKSVEHVASGGDFGVRRQPGKAV